MDVPVQAEAGGQPLTLENMASQTVGRDAATGGAGGSHPLTAAGAFGVLLLDTAVGRFCHFSSVSGVYTRVHRRFSARIWAF